MLGVVGAGFEPTGGGLAYQSPHGWMLSTVFGDLNHADEYSAWEGNCSENELKEGDAVVQPPPAPPVAPPPR